MIHAPPAAPPCPLLRLPPELRLQIYEYLPDLRVFGLYLLVHRNGHIYNTRGPSYKGSQLAGLLASCKLLHEEVEPLLYTPSLTCYLGVPEPSERSEERPRRDMLDLGPQSRCAFLRRLPRIQLLVKATVCGEPEAEWLHAGRLESLERVIDVLGSRSENPLPLDEVRVMCEIERVRPAHVEALVAVLRGLCCKPDAKIIVCSKLRRIVPEAVFEEMVAALGGEGYCCRCCPCHRGVGCAAIARNYGVWLA